MFGGYIDGDFLAPKNGAKLASLFGSDQAESQQGNDCFQFTAPKQPKRNSAPALGPPPQKPAPPPEVPAVLLANAVHAFHYVNGQYVKQGKVGAAILGSHESKEYKILVYGSQQKQITAAQIHLGFVFTVQPSNYGSFYDDQRQNWSLMFESEKAGVDFCKQVCVAKWNSAPPSTDVPLTQDLVLGLGQAVDTGDTVEVAFTGWLLQNHTTGQVFDSNLNREKLQRVKLGAGKAVKGWEEGMLGMRKGGRRLIIVPAGTGYVSKSVSKPVPPGSTLVFEVEIRRVKFSKDGGMDASSVGSVDSGSGSVPAATASQVPSLDLMGTESSISAGQGDLSTRLKTSSPSEQDTTKAKLISRMAKMGQPMLRFLSGAIPAQLDSSDSDNEGGGQPVPHTLPSHPAASASASASPSPSPTQLPMQISTRQPPCAVSAHPMVARQPEPTETTGAQTVDASCSHAFQPYSSGQIHFGTSQLQPLAPVFPTQQVPFHTTDVTSFLLTEARQHNTEIQLVVGKIADKVDQLVTKVHELQRNGSHFCSLSSVSMETALILNNIQRMDQENTALKREVLEKSAQVDEQNREIAELKELNQRYVTQISQLQEKCSEALSALQEANLVEAGVLQLKVTELQLKLNAALQASQSHCAHISSLETQVEELKHAAEQAGLQESAERQRRKELRQREQLMEEEMQDLRAEKENLEQRLGDSRRRWQQERERLLAEQEEEHAASQQEREALHTQLRRARARKQLPVEQQEDWQRRCEGMLALERAQHGRAVTELMEQRGQLECTIQHLQDQIAALERRAEKQEMKIPLTEKQELVMPLVEKQELEMPLAEGQELEIPLAEKQELEMPLALEQQMEIRSTEKPELEIPLAVEQQVDLRSTEKPELEMPLAEKQQLEISLAKNRACQKNNQSTSASSAETLALQRNPEEHPPYANDKGEEQEEVLVVELQQKGEGADKQESSEAEEDSITVLLHCDHATAGQDDESIGTAHFEEEPIDSQNGPGKEPDLPCVQSACETS